MEKAELIQYGATVADTLIRYLEKDAIGGIFLNTYLSQNSGQDKQKEALSHLMASSTEMQQATEQMTGRAAENIERLGGIFKAIEKLEESAGKIEEDHKKYAEQFKNLIEQTNSIKNQVNGISEISEQTNLLSFNASIEAAHAGALGAGFRIIANEVKALSENTQKATGKIKTDMERLSESIKRLEQDTQKTVQALSGLAKETENTLKQFESVRKLNSANNSDVEQISEAIAANMQGMKNIVQTVQDAEEVSKKSESLFADSASKNEMLFNDLYSFVYELKAIFADLAKAH